MDLKARLIAHFEDPMSDERTVDNDGLAACESGFERDLMSRLLNAGYRVQPQVGALGFRIDLVVEGADGRRLAIECDGDRFHGPEQWCEDMRRQRVLERVGWKFWRCFASSFYRDPTGITADLVATLGRLGIEPLAASGDRRSMYRFCERRTITAGVSAPAKIDLARGANDKLLQRGAAALRVGLAVGDKVILVFADDKRRMSVQLTLDENHPENGKLATSSPLGKAILGAEEGDEVEFRLENGRDRKVLVEAIEKQKHTALDEPRRVVG